MLDLIKGLPEESELMAFKTRLDTRISMDYSQEQAAAEFKSAILHTFFWNTKFDVSNSTDVGRGILHYWLRDPFRPNDPNIPKGYRHSL